MASTEGINSGGNAKNNYGRANLGKDWANGGIRKLSDEGKDKASGGQPVIDVANGKMPKIDETNSNLLV